MVFLTTEILHVTGTDLHRSQRYSSLIIRLPSTLLTAGLLATAVAKMPPTEIHPGRTYIQVTTNNPQAIKKAPSPGVGLEYRGPVGELEGEYVFEVTSADGYLAPDSAQWKREAPELLTEVKNIPGVQGVQELKAQQRTKRDEL